MKLRAALAALVLVVSPTARSVIGTIDVAPAATLLYPYFEVDTADPNGVTTLLAIQNTSATAVVAYFTLWSDLGVPTQSFNVYLTGYDTQTINLRDLFDLGRFPVTADAGADPSDTVSNQGILSQDINFPGSGGGDLDELDPWGDDGPYPDMTMPYSVPLLPEAVRAELVRLHTGVAATTSYWVSPGRCASQGWGDQIARGYVTADTVNSQEGRKPTNMAFYWPVLTFQNVLFGDWLVINPSQNFAEGDVAVHIEASNYYSAPPPNGVYSFYGGYDGALTRNGREALPTRFLTHWLGDSELITWRDGARLPSATGYTCGGGSYNAFPMGVSQVSPFDSEENPLSYTAGSAFQFGAQRNRVDDSAFPGTGAVKQGWMVVDLNATAAGGSVYTTAPLVRQGWLLHRRRSEPPGGQGRFSSMSPAIQLNNASSLTPPFPPPAAPASVEGGAR